MIFHSPFAAYHGNVTIKETLGGYRMFKKIAVSAGVFAVAALWFAPSVVGSANGQTAEEPTLAEVSRDASPMFSGFNLNLVSAPKVLPGGISEDEAAKIALARGAAIRAAREDGRTLTTEERTALGMAPEPQPATPEAVDVASTPQPAIEAAIKEAVQMWTVTGSTVNLRSGPGTSHAVVDQAKLGEIYRPLSDTSSDWIEIELTDGSSAWIYAKFFAPVDG